MIQAQKEYSQIYESVINVFDRLVALMGDEIVTTEEYNDILEGDDKDNTLFGGSGDDILIGLEGADTLDGGEGVDLASYETSSAVEINLKHNYADGGEATGDKFEVPEKKK